MIVLASSSKRRQELIKQISNDFIIAPSNIDEREITLPNDLLCQDLSKRKAYDVFKSYPNDIIIACDTIVIYKDKIFNKPKDEHDAFNMLKALSNNKHIVLTGYTILSKDIEINKTVKSIVYFNNLSDDYILSYIKENTCYDKAGAYAIQDEKYHFVKNVEGSINNVIGFPLEEIKKDLIKHHLI